MAFMIHFPATIIGLMSGTSADGVDAAILRTDGRDIVEAGASHFVPYDEALRGEILGLMRGVGDEAAIASALTDVHIAAVRALMAKANLAAKEVALIGFHGQTIRHAPAEGITVQIGEPQRMARELGIPVVADFRTNDVAHGGQGAPLVPLYHAALAAHLPKPLMVVNIGGVANVTWMGKAESRVQSLESSEGKPVTGLWTLDSDHFLIAFDCGPGNALIDDWVRARTGVRCDENGALAAAGMSDAAAVKEFLRDPFFLLDAPKSLDRLHFDALFARIKNEGWSVEDGAATLTTITAAAIALSCGAVPEIPKQILVCGGGRHNPTLMRLLTQSVTMPVLPVEAVGWNGDMLEAEAFAYLAARSVQGLALSLPTTTGVRQPVTGGVFYPAGYAGVP